MSKEGHTISLVHNTKVTRRIREGITEMWFLSRYFPASHTMFSRGLHDVVSRTRCNNTRWCHVASRSVNRRKFTCRASVHCIPQPISIFTMTPPPKLGRGPGKKVGCNFKETLPYKCYPRFACDTYKNEKFWIGIKTIESGNFSLKSNVAAIH